MGSYWEDQDSRRVEDYWPPDIISQVQDTVRPTVIIIVVVVIITIVGNEIISYTMENDDSPGVRCFIDANNKVSIASSTFFTSSDYWYFVATIAVAKLTTWVVEAYKLHQGDAVTVHLYN